MENVVIEYAANEGTALLLEYLPQEAWVVFLTVFVANAITMFLPTQIQDKGKWYQKAANYGLRILNLIALNTLKNKNLDDIKKKK